MPKSKSANRDIDYDDVVTNDMELEEGASEEMDSRWNNRFILISFGKETFGFAPSGTTTFIFSPVTKLYFINNFIILHISEISKT